MITYRGEF